MSVKSALEAEIATEVMAHLYAVARSEIARLVTAGWKRESAIVCVWASPRWPYADEDNMMPGVLGPYTTKASVARSPK